MGEEAESLQHLEERLASLEPGVVVTWNGSGFDLPFLSWRAAHCGVPLSLRIFPAGSLSKRRALPGHRSSYRATWGAHGHLDAYLAWRDLPSEKGLPMGLKAVARRRGLNPIQVDRRQIHLLEEEQLLNYVASDAEVARELAIMRWSDISDRIDSVPDTDEQGDGQPFLLQASATPNQTGTDNADRDR